MEHISDSSARMPIKGAAEKMEPTETDRIAPSGRFAPQDTIRLEARTYVIRSIQQRENNGVLYIFYIAQAPDGWYALPMEMTDQNAKLVDAQIDAALQKTRKKCKDWSTGLQNA